MCTVSSKEGRNLPQQRKKRCGKCLESQPTEQKRKRPPNKIIKKDTKFGNKDWMVTHNSITKNTFVLSSKTSCRPTMLACFSLKKVELEG